MKAPKTRGKARRTSTGAYSGRTRFDKWLEDQIHRGTELAAVIQPPTPYPYRTNKVDDCSFRVRIMEVDRYSVRMEFSDHVSEEDGAVWWIAKDSIRAVGGWVDDPLEL